jgi:hypothetical protein
MKHVEFLVEEDSAEALLKGILPKLLPAGVSFAIHPFQGKRDLLTKLPDRLRGYRQWLPPDWRLVVLVDEDRQDCCTLKQQLEKAAKEAGFTTKATAQHAGTFTILNRISIEELEAWFFGDVPALVALYPGVSPNLGSKEKYRDPDAIKGGTWEALERVLQQARYYPSGLPKIEVARAMGNKMVPARNTSRSFQVFCSGLVSLQPSRQNASQEYPSSRPSPVPRKSSGQSSPPTASAQGAFEFSDSPPI